MTLEGWRGALTTAQGLAELSGDEHVPIVFHGEPADAAVSYGESAGLLCSTDTAHQRVHRMANEDEVDEHLQVAGIDPNDGQWRVG